MQIIILAGVLVLVGIAIVKKRKSSTPSEITYQHQLIEAAVYGIPNSAIIITNGLNKIMLWNNGAEKLFGYKEAEVKGKDLNIVGINLPETILKNTPLDTEAMRSGDNKIPISLTVGECKVGNITHYIALAKSIWERKEQEALVKRELELLNWGEKLAGIGSWNWHVNSPEMVSDLVMVTEGFNNLFETDDQVTDVQLLMDKVWHEDRERVFRILGDAQRTQTDYQIEYRIAKKNGKVIWIKCYGKFFLTKNGNTKNIIGTIQKINPPNEI